MKIGLLRRNTDFLRDSTLYREYVKFVDAYGGKFADAKDYQDVLLILNHVYNYDLLKFKKNNEGELPHLVFQQLFLNNPE